MKSGVCALSLVFEVSPGAYSLQKYIAYSNEERGDRTQGLKAEKTITGHISKE